MREHLRIDTFKVFPEDDKHLRLLMANEKTKNKSEGYRIALEAYGDNKAIAHALQDLTAEVTATRSEIKALAEQNDDLNFVVRSQAQAIEELKTINAQQTALLHQALSLLKGGSN